MQSKVTLRAAEGVEPIWAISVSCSGFPLLRVRFRRSAAGFPCRRLYTPFAILIEVCPCEFQRTGFGQHCIFAKGDISRPSTGKGTKACFQSPSDGEAYQKFSLWQRARDDTACLSEDAEEAAVHGLTSSAAGAHPRPFLATSSWRFTVTSLSRPVAGFCKSRAQLIDSRSRTWGLLWAFPERRVALHACPILLLFLMPNRAGGRT